MKHPYVSPSQIYADWKRVMESVILWRSVPGWMHVLHKHLHFDIQQDRQSLWLSAMQIVKPAANMCCRFTSDDVMQS